MSRHKNEQELSGSEVTTEPQRLALEAMSQELVKKLNIMVAEQEKRAREFSNLQHSLSALPTAVPTPQLTVPKFTTEPAPQKNIRKNKPQKVYPHAVPPAPYPPIPSTPDLPNIPTFTEPSYSTPEPPRQARRKPVVISGSSEKKEEGIGVGTIITIVIVFFIIVAKGC